MKQKQLHEKKESLKMEVVNDFFIPSLISNLISTGIIPQ
jgi:hypothetical protein